MHADGALVSPDVHHEESTQVADDCIGFGVILVVVLGDSPSPSYFSKKVYAFPLYLTYH